MELKNITLLDFMNSDNKTYKREKALLKEYDISDAGQLIDMMDSGWEELARDIFKRMRIQAENLVKRSQEDNFRENIFLVKDDIDKIGFQVLSNADKTTLANILVLFPLSSNDYLKTLLGKYRIEEIKYLLSHYNLRGKNALVASLDGMGNAKIPKMLKALEFYQDQIERLHKENMNHNGVNLFYLNMETKLEMVREEMDTIIDYLFSLTKDYVWGSISDKEKLSILEAVKRGNICKDKRLINLADVISNYVTLGELERGITRNRTLDRFKKE